MIQLLTATLRLFKLNPLIYDYCMVSKLMMTKLNLL
jgi:hypothetical protein